MFKNVHLDLGDFIYEDCTTAVFNRTGAQLEIGHCAAFNLDFINTTYDEHENPAVTADNDWRRNVVAVTTNNAVGMVGVAIEVIPDGGCGLVQIYGQVRVMAGATLTAGDLLTVANAGVKVTELATAAAWSSGLTALATASAVRGIALTGGADTELIKAWWDGSFGGHAIAGAD